MKLRAILEIVDRAYGPDGLVLQYDDEPNQNHGDGLAAFIRNEIVDTYDPQDESQIQQALNCLESAVLQLNDCILALSRHNDQEEP